MEPTERMSSPSEPFSVVVAAYNEEANLPLLYDRLCALDWAALGLAPEFVFVDDHSRDATPLVLGGLAARDPRVKVLRFSRNFGSHKAFTAGLEHATGNAAVILAADLQDPPELIATMMEHWRAGIDCVLMRRSSRDGETWFKKFSSTMFYRVLRHIGDVDIPPDVGDFRLMSRRAVDALRRCHERTRYMKGLFAWVGFPTITLEYQREARHAGTTKWNYARLLNLAIEGITSFSTAPLRLASYTGLFVALSAFLYSAKVFIKALLYGDPVPGYPSLMMVVLFLGGIQLLALGLIGEYLGRVFTEVKQRPLYLVADVHGQGPNQPAPTAHPDSRPLLR